MVKFLLRIVLKKILTNLTNKVNIILSDNKYRLIIVTNFKVKAGDSYGTRYNCNTS